MSDLDQLRQAERMLARIATVADAMQVIDYAAAARDLAERAKLGEAAMNHATAIRLRAERRLAEIVGQGQATGQISKAGRPQKIFGDAKNSSPVSSSEDLGIPHHRLHEARKLAELSDDEITSLADQATAQGRRLSRREALDAARAARIERTGVDPASVPHQRQESGWDLLDAIQTCVTEIDRAVRLAGRMTGIPPEGLLAMREYTKQIQAGSQLLASILDGGGITDSALAEWMAGE